MATNWIASEGNLLLLCLGAGLARLLGFLAVDQHRGGRAGHVGVGIHRAVGVEPVERLGFDRADLGAQLPHPLDTGGGDQLLPCPDGESFVWI